MRPPVSRNTPRRRGGRADWRSIAALGYDDTVAWFASAGQNSMVAIAQSVEHRLVVPVVAGSSPVSHPKMNEARLTLEFSCEAGFVV